MSFTYYVHVPFFFVFEASRAMKPRGTHTSEIRRRITGERAPRSRSEYTPTTRSTAHSRTEQSKVSFVHHSTDPQSDVARARSWAAIYVQDFDAPCVLQFAWISALCCALHRSTSQVIHRSGSYNNDNDLSLFLPRSSLDEDCGKGIVPINSRTRFGIGRCGSRADDFKPVSTSSDKKQVFARLASAGTRSPHLYSLSLSLNSLTRRYSLDFFHGTSTHTLFEQRKRSFDATPTRLQASGQHTLEKPSVRITTFSPYRTRVPHTRETTRDIRL